MNYHLLDNLIRGLLLNPIGGQENSESFKLYKLLSEGDTLLLNSQVESQILQAFVSYKVILKGKKWNSHSILRGIFSNFF
jgi:hypothetical protein